MKPKTFKLDSVNSSLNDSYILIEYNNSQPLTKYSKILLHKFMSMLNSNIGANTNLNYHIEPVKDFKIKIPIHVYTNDEKKLSMSDLISKRISTLTKHLSTIDWSKFTNLQEQWIIYSLKTSGIDISKDFTISTFIDESIDFENLDHEVLNINLPSAKQPKIKRITYKDGSSILYLSSPYLTDFGIFANLTTDFSEMGMSFNALHLYEHLMTYAWKGIDFGKIKLMNGSTWPNALCSVFVITQTLESMKTFAAAFIKFYLESRDAGFWESKEMIDAVKLETQRTISETRLERTLSSLCRSDFHAYDFKYNTKIFEYWSQRPFDLLISGPDSLNKLFMNESTINKFISLHPSRKIQKPGNVVYKTLPLDTIKMKELHQFRVIGADKDEIKSRLLNPTSENKALYGIDSKIISDVENLDGYNSVLHMLCYGNRLFTDDELNQFVQKSVIPFSCTFFSDTSLNSKFAGDYLFDPAVDNDDVELFKPFDAREKTEESDDSKIGEDCDKHDKRGKKKHKGRKQ